MIADYTTGDVVCRGCGEVQAQRIADQRAEWRSFDDDITGDRVGGDLQGFAEKHFGGASGAKRKHKGKHEVTGGSLVNKRSKRMDRIRNIAIQVMREVAKLGLKEEVKNVAIKMLDQAFEADEGTAFNGVNETLFTAAVLYLSCKECSVVKTIAEFARLYGFDKYEVSDPAPSVCQRFLLQMPLDFFCLEE
jgi:transcription initiation factor TFIIB